MVLKKIVRDFWKIITSFVCTVTCCHYLSRHCLPLNCHCRQLGKQEMRSLKLCVGKRFGTVYSYGEPLEMAALVRLSGREMQQIAAWCCKRALGSPSSRDLRLIAILTQPPSRRRRRKLKWFFCNPETFWWNYLSKYLRKISQLSLCLSLFLFSRALPWDLYFRRFRGSLRMTSSMVLL